MSIFNSLGSNYDFKFIFKPFFAEKNYSLKLQNFLEEKYKGKAILVYKGRQAIELALRISNLPKNSFVAINGFTCYAVYEAIKNAGYKPIYLDISISDLNFSAQILEDKFKEVRNIGAVIVQNTLGYSCDIEKIKKICEEKGIILIEDLAHSAGLIYPNGKEAGTLGDFVAFSFSQDKIVDGVSGGALIIRNKKFAEENIELGNLNLTVELRDRFYPVFTFVIRNTYLIGLGKIIHEILRNLNLLSSPMANSNALKLNKLSGWYSYLIFGELINLQNNLNHRKQIAKIYINKLNPKILTDNVKKNFDKATNLRFPILVENRKSLIEYLKNKNIYVSDIWYDSPIAPKKYMKLTDYVNQCPISEEISESIVNLPTHRNVSVKEADRITKEVNKWLKLA